MAGVEFLKGHGTQNDFVLLPDVRGALELTTVRVRALCDRRRGLGADGVLRIVPTAHMPDQPASSAEWFMDYRNADGSVAEMCGNGARVFARYLVDAGLVAPGRFDIGTRAGVCGVMVDGDLVTVDMGPATILGQSSATVSGQSFPGIVVDVGNPHLACPIALDQLAELDLEDQPGYDSAMFAHGVNIEFFATESVDALRMRVHERGVGETRSCGTGTVAAVAGALHQLGRTTGKSTVDVPGGRVWVSIEKSMSTLTGPAVLVARGELSLTWWTTAGDN